MRRIGLAALVATCGVAGALAAVVLAGPSPASTFQATTTSPTATTTAPTVTQPPPPPPPPAPRVIAAGVTIGGVHVGGLSAEAALSVVRTAFAAPLVLRLQGDVFRPTPHRLRTVAYVRPAVRRALAAPPGRKVTLVVRVHRGAVRAYVSRLAPRVQRVPRDAYLVLRRLRPVVVPDRTGRSLDREHAARAIVQALRTNERFPIRLRTRAIRARVTARDFGPVVVIRRGSNRLFLYNRSRLVRLFTVATGQARYPTPLGRFSIVAKWRHPWWYPPNSDWARGKQPIPPGPGNPLGTRWMGLSAPGVGIHGTPDAASIGYSVSHGCIRMRIPDAEWLFTRVSIGTTVFIVHA